ncbi:MFS transporter [Patescibacteria group bacterium]
MPQRTNYFFRNSIRREVKELFASVWIQNFAVQLITLFIPIYFWKLGYTAWEIAFFFVIVYTVYFFIVPLGAKLSMRYGYEHTIIFSIPVMIVYHVALYGIEFYDWSFFVAAVLFAVAKTLYWPPYHADLARFGGKKQRGRELSVLVVVGQLTIFIAPLLAGTVLEELSFGWLFFIGSVLMAISAIPLMLSKEKVFPKKIRYWDFHRAYFSKFHVRRAITYMGLGEELVAMVIWPIFIFSVVGDFLLFGGILTGAMLISSILMLFTGRLTDRFRRSSVMKGVTLFYFVSWFPKLLIKTPVHAFVTDSFGQFLKNANLLPLHAMAYTEAKENYGDKVIMGAMLFEMGYIVSKIIAALALMLVGLFTNDLRILMLVGAVMVLFYLFVKELPEKKKLA